MNGEQLPNIERIHQSSCSSARCNETATTMADTVYREAGVFPKDEIDPDGKLTEAQETRLTKLWQNFEDYEAVYMLACYARAYSKAHPKLATKMAVKKAYEGAAKERQKHVDAYHNAAIYYLKAVIEASPQVAAQKAGAKLMQAKEKKRAVSFNNSIYTLRNVEADVVIVRGR